MNSTGNIGEVVKRLLLISNILSSVKIDKLVVPEVTEDSCEAILNCVFSGAEDSVLRWLFNGSPVFKWRPKTEPIVSGIFKDRIDLSYRASNIQSTQHQAALRIMKISPEFSGEYTCVVESRGQEDRQTRTMIVFSPERDLRLEYDNTEIKCIANRIYPQPELTIEYNKYPIAQQQRIWRNGSYFDAECSAPKPHDINRCTEFACRLQIPQVAYTAITKKFVSFDKENNAANSNGLPSRLLAYFAVLKMYFSLGIVKC